MTIITRRVPCLYKFLSTIRERMQLLQRVNKNNQILYSILSMQQKQTSVNPTGISLLQSRSKGWISNRQIHQFSSLTHDDHNPPIDCTTNSKYHHGEKSQFLFETVRQQQQQPHDGQSVDLPEYLKKHYWWAYINPFMISLLDRKWLVDIVLWGNFTTLRNAAIQELLSSPSSSSLSEASSSNQQVLQQSSVVDYSTNNTSYAQHIEAAIDSNNNDTHTTNATTAIIPEQKMIYGSTLQISCVYADLTETIVQHLAPNATLDVIDVVPGQLNNLQRKLNRTRSIQYNVHQQQHQKKQQVTLTCCDASKLYEKYPNHNNNSFDNIIIFFLLHETPNNVREQILYEACRLCKVDSGKITIIDYHQPNTKIWSTIMYYMYQLYEPFAIDLWNHPITRWLPKTAAISLSSSSSPSTSWVDEPNRLEQQKQEYTYTLNHPIETFFDGLYQKAVITKRYHRQQQYK